MIQLNPYLTFNGNCREAMNFYKECFGGELNLQTVAETPMAAQCPAGMQHHIMHSALTAPAFILMASDMVSPAGFHQGTDMSLALNFDKENEIRECFKKLSEDGKVIDELKNAPWGAIFGVAQDKFGKVWMFNCEKK
ncbi:MAG: VOC family protein [Chitinophagaceae bacterium]|nr:MAG: VOC family protein [Chitinophagaceae bacterium]